MRKGYKQTEVGVIPEEWEPAVIGDCVRFAGGGQPPKSTFIYRPSADYVRLIQIRDYKNDEFATYIPASLATKWCSVDDVMIGRYGPPIFQILRGIEGAYNVALMKATPTERLDRDYLYYFLQQEALFRFVELLSRRSSGQTGVDLNGLREYPLPLPPLPEQRAIAAALGDVDALITGLDQLIAKKRDIKQATMQQLLTGQKRLPGFRGEWVIRRIEDLADVDSDNLHNDTRSDYVFYYISLEDVDVGRLRSHSEQIFATAPSRARRRLAKGDILVSTVRPNLQSHLHFRSSEANWICSTGFCVVRARPNDLEPGYLFYYLFADGMQRQIDALLTGSNYPAINGGDVRALQFPVPSLQEQSAIAAVLSDMDAEITAIEQRLEKTRSLKLGMMQELLTGKTRLV